MSGARPSCPAKRALNGGPQMVELSRDGRRVYFTNSLYASWTSSFIPMAFAAGWSSWMLAPGGIQLDPKLSLDFGELRGHQSGCREATPHPTSTATHDSKWPWVVLRRRRLPWSKSSMGWLFCPNAWIAGETALGGSVGVGSIALGHAVAIAAAVFLVRLLQPFFPSTHSSGLSCHSLRTWHLSILPSRSSTSSRHESESMGIGRLVLLMASAHGAGLMIVPVLCSSHVGMSHNMTETMSSDTRH